MGLFKSLKGRVSQKDDEAQIQSPEITYDGSKPKAEKQSIFKSHSATEDTKSNSHAEPSNRTTDHNSFAQQTQTSNSDTNPPPYESWLAIPDTSQLPPPPSISNEYSSANNASYDSAEAGHKWCARNPVYTPSTPKASSIVETSQQGHLGLDPPPRGFKGSITKLDDQTWQIQTDKRQPDTTLTSTLPIYFATISNPLLSSTQPSDPVTFSTSISITSIHPAALIAIGFASKPYPTFRLPGWHRASLAVHSDDGNRYINDPWGGIDFTRPFAASGQVRLTMTIFPRVSPVQQYHGKIPDVRRVGGGLPKCVARVDVQRNGVDEGGWDIHEEKDAERDEGIEGLQGEADLYVAIGVFGAADFVVRFGN